MTKVFVKPGEKIAHVLERFQKLNSQLHKGRYPPRKPPCHETPGEQRRWQQRKKQHRARERADAFRPLKLE